MTKYAKRAMMGKLKPKRRDPSMPAKLRFPGETISTERIIEVIISPALPMATHSLISIKKYKLKASA